MQKVSLKSIKNGMAVKNHVERIRNGYGYPVYEYHRIKRGDPGLSVSFLGDGLESLGLSSNDYITRTESNYDEVLINGTDYSTDVNYIDLQYTPTSEFWIRTVINGVMYDNTRWKLNSDGEHPKRITWNDANITLKDFAINRYTYNNVLSPIWNMRNELLMSSLILVIYPTLDQVNERVILTNGKYKMCDVFPETYQNINVFPNNSLNLDFSQLTLMGDIISGCDNCYAIDFCTMNCDNSQEINLENAFRNMPNIYAVYDGMTLEDAPQQ